MPGLCQRGTRAVAGGLLAATMLVGPAAAAEPGGATAPTARGSVGGVEYGSPLRGPQAPRATRFALTPHTVTAGGSPPSIVLRIDQPGVPLVTARIVVSPPRGRAIVIRLGAVRVGRVLRPRWPEGVGLRAGRYTFRVHAADQGGLQLTRPKAAPGRAVLVVRPKPRPKPRPRPVVTPQPAPVVTPAPVLTPVTVAGGVYPVQGPHSYGDLFAVPRQGYRHQGVDILAAEGTPVVSPTAGTIRYVDYQASAAGEYVVERLADGRDIFLAHCVRHSTAVAAGQAVAAGTLLCRVGRTGDATGPHLHFELWPQGWRDLKGTAPVDPLPQLKAWA